MVFIENKGQVVDQVGRPNNSVLYIFPLPGNTVVLKANGFSYDTYAEPKKSEGLKTNDLTRQEMAGIISANEEGLGKKHIIVSI